MTLGIAFQAFSENKPLTSSSFHGNVELSLTFNGGCGRLGSSQCCPFHSQLIWSYSGVFPKLTGHFDRINPVRFPPCSLVTSAVNGAVVYAAKRDCEFVADLAAESSRLSEAKMVRIRGR